MQKIHRSAVMQKCLKLAHPLSRNDIKNVKNSKVRGHGKMPKSSRSAVTKKCEKVADLKSKKFKKCIGQQLCKNAYNSPVCCHRIVPKMPKTHRYAVTEKYWSHRSAVTKKCQKVAGPQSRKNDKKSQVRGHEIMPKSRKCAIARKYKKYIRRQLCKNA